MKTNPIEELRDRLARLEAENRKLNGRLRSGVIAAAALMGLAALTLAARPGAAGPQDLGGPLVGGARSSFARIGSVLVNFDHVTHVRMESADDPRAGLTVHYAGGDQQDRFEGDDAQFVLRWMVGTGSAPPLGQIEEGLGVPRRDLPGAVRQADPVIPPPPVDPDGR